MDNPYKAIVDERGNLLVHVRMSFVDHLPPTPIPMTSRSVQELLDQVYRAGRLAAEEHAIVKVGDLGHDINGVRRQLEHFVERHLAKNSGT